jgi:hypothetical protein
MDKNDIGPIYCSGLFNDDNQICSTGDVQSGRAKTIVLNLLILTAMHRG